MVTQTREGENMRNSYSEFVSRKRAEYGERFSEASLDRRFVPYYESGQRIRVETCGLTLTGTVGVTSGWQPCFLLMLRSNSIGSVWTLGKRDKIIAVKRGRKYETWGCAESSQIYANR